MGQYRISRDIEASIIDYIRNQLVGNWSNVACEKTFSRIYNGDLPAICVRCGTTVHDRAEIGESSTIRTANILIDIFATDDGQRLDLKDFLIRKLKMGMPYYEYTISGGAVTDKTQNGRIRIMDISDEPIDFDVPKDDLEVYDRYRHLLSLSVSLGRIETNE